MAGVFGTMRDYIRADLGRHDISATAVFAPCFVYAAVGHLLSYGLAEEGLFRVAGDRRITQHMLGTLTAGKCMATLDSREYSPHEVGDCLKAFFRQFGDCLMQTSLIEDWIAAAGDSGDILPKHIEAVKCVLARLPVCNRRVLERVAFLLNQVSKNSAVNRMTPDNLSIVWSVNLLWSQADLSNAASVLAAAVNSKRVNRIISLLIKHYESVFTDPQPNRLVQRKISFMHSVQCMVGAEDTVWCTDSNGVCFIFSTKNVKLTKMFDSQQSRIYSLVYAANQAHKCMWAASATSVAVWDEETELARFDTQQPDKQPDKQTPLQLLLVDDRTVLGAGDHTIQLWDRGTLDFREALPFDGSALCVTQESSHLWIGCADGSVHVLENSTCESVRVLSRAIAGGGICAITVDRANMRVWAAANDPPVICVWDAKTFDLCKELTWPGMGNTLAMHAIGDMVWTANADSKGIRVWNGKDFKLDSTLNTYAQQHTTFVLPVWNKRKKAWQVWTSSGDKSLCVWAPEEKHFPFLELSIKQLQTQTLQQSMTPPPAGQATAVNDASEKLRTRSQSQPPRRINLLRPSASSSSCIARAASPPPLARAKSQQPVQQQDPSRVECAPAAVMAAPAVPVLAPAAAEAEFAPPETVLQSRGHARLCSQVSVKDLMQAAIKVEHQENEQQIEKAIQVLAESSIDNVGDLSHADECVWDHLKAVMHEETVSSLYNTVHIPPEWQPRLMDCLELAKAAKRRGVADLGVLGDALWAAAMEGNESLNKDARRRSQDSQHMPQTLADLPELWPLPFRELLIQCWSPTPSITVATAIHRLERLLGVTAQERERPHVTLSPSKRLLQPPVPTSPARSRKAHSHVPLGSEMGLLRPTAPPIVTSGHGRVKSQGYAVTTLQTAFQQPVQPRHNFVPHTFRTITLCDNCHHVIMGVMAKGCKCTVCKYNAHKKCRDAAIATACPGECV
eukprot:TRINITY_DN6642_c0_g1_i1.p1 TRINITY_DN6642_c0_g1~~TRINITY_DN6642_c0_g1_i1.p1  ORF type:complete len:971 (-),score=246.07 TRINITY_DN6642_c0_g1_i1:60-2945(-)